MKNIKAYSIMGLFFIGLIGFCWIQLVIIPNRKEAEEQYALEQLSPLTQDYHYIDQYESNYMGDSSNTSNLFRSLPLAQNEMTFQLYPDELQIEIHYPTTLIESTLSMVTDEDSNESERYHELLAQKALLYNATAGFTLIKNVEQLTFVFDDETIDFSRKDIESLYTDLDKRLDENIWKREVQKPLLDVDYVEYYFDRVATIR